MHSIQAICERCSSWLGHTKIESTVRYLGIEVDDAIEIAEKIDICSEGRVSAVAVPHTADVIGDTGTVADCVRAKVRFCIVGSGARASTLRRPSD
jgi:hypothetical protein